MHRAAKKTAPAALSSNPQTRNESRGSGPLGRRCIVDLETSFNCLSWALNAASNKPVTHPSRHHKRRQSVHYLRKEKKKNREKRQSRALIISRIEREQTRPVAKNTRRQTKERESESLRDIFFPTDFLTVLTHSCTKKKYPKTERKKRRMLAASRACSLCLFFFSPSKQTNRHPYDFIYFVFVFVLVAVCFSLSTRPDNGKKPKVPRLRSSCSPRSAIFSLALVRGEEREREREISRGEQGSKKAQGPE